MDQVFIKGNVYLQYFYISYWKRFVLDVIGCVLEICPKLSMGQPTYWTGCVLKICPKLTKGQPNSWPKTKDLEMLKYVLVNIVNNQHFAFNLSLHCLSGKWDGHFWTGTCKPPPELRNNINFNKTNNKFYFVKFLLKMSTEMQEVFTLRWPVKILPVNHYNQGKLFFMESFLQFITIWPVLRKVSGLNSKIHLSDTWYQIPNIRGLWKDILLLGK